MQKNKLYECFKRSFHALTVVFHKHLRRFGKGFIFLHLLSYLLNTSFTTSAASLLEMSHHYRRKVSQL